MSLVGRRSRPAAFTAADNHWLGGRVPRRSADRPQGVR
jgi:hypothetical protein